jgi:hypothetical protein
MWIKKSSDEILEEKRKAQKRLRVVTVALYFLLLSVFVVLIPSKSVYRLVNNALVAGLAAWWYYAKTHADINAKKGLVCPKCESVKSPDGQLRCQCGGEFVDMREMKWVEGK